MLTRANLAGVPSQLTIIKNESEKTILDEIETASTKTPFVIIDLEGTASRLMSYAISQADLVVIPIKEQQQDALAALDVIKEIHRDMKAVRRNIPFSILITQSKVIAKSRTARFIAQQFRMNSKIDTFNCEIFERDAFSAVFSVGGTVRTMTSKDVNNLDAAIRNVEDYTLELIQKLRINRENLQEVA